MRRDALFYQIFKRFPALFFELVGQHPAQVRGYQGGFAMSSIRDQMPVLARHEGDWVGMYTLIEVVLQKL